MEIILSITGMGIVRGNPQSILASSDFVFGISGAAIYIKKKSEKRDQTNRLVQNLREQYALVIP